MCYTQVSQKINCLGSNPDWAQMESLYEYSLKPGCGLEGWYKSKRTKTCNELL